jgi:hypothetical protein
VADPRRRADGWLRLAALVLLAGALYGNTFRNELVWDDRLTAAVPADAATILFHRTGAFYRPLVMASFAVDRVVWRGSPVGFHLTNVTAHVAVAWLLGALVESLGLGAGVALGASLLFAAHPVQTEAVTYVSGRTDVLCALFVLLGLLAWRRARGAADAAAVASAAAFGAALLCKEAAMLVPLALLVPGAHPAERPPRPFLPIAVTLTWLAAWTAGAGPAVRAGGLASRLPAIAVATLGYLRLLVWPSGLHLERFTVVPGWSAGMALAAWAALIGTALGLVLIARRVPGGLLLLAVAALTYLPVCGVVPVYPAIADRALFTAEHFLYLPLLGLCPLLATAWPQSGRRVAPVVIAAVLVAWGIVVVRRNADWRDEETIFRHTIAYNPPAARVWFDLGNLALAKGNLDEAARLYEAALAREPADADAHLNLGVARQRQGRYAEAEAQYRAAIAGNPRLGEAYRGLAALLAARGAGAEAAEVLSRSRRLPAPGGR